jgi:hypothetical protein
MTCQKGAISLCVALSAGVGCGGGTSETTISTSSAASASGQGAGTSATVGATTSSTTAAITSGATSASTSHLTTSGATATATGTSTTGPATTGTSTTAAATTGATTGGVTSNGTSGSGTTSGVSATSSTSGTTSGACSPSSGGASFATCATNTDCECPDLCVLDPGYGFKLCEEPCAVTANCLPLDTYCGPSGTCATNFCNTSYAQGVAQSSYGEFCNAAGTQDGYCLEQSTTVAGNTLYYGVCFQSGMVSLPSYNSGAYTYYGCSATADRTDLGAVCDNRGTCQPGFSADACYEECDPLGVSSSNCLTPYTKCYQAAALGAGAALPPLDENSPHDGICVPCGMDQYGCSGGSYCCSGTCGTSGLCCEVTGGGCNVDADCCTTTCNQTYGQCN